MKASGRPIANAGFVSSLIGAALAAILVPVIVGNLSAAGIAGRRQGSYRVVEYAAGHLVLMGVCFSFFTLLAVLVWRFPGKTDPAMVPWVILVFVFFALLSLYSLGLGKRWTVLWNEVEVEGADFLGRRHRFSWPDLSQVENFPSLSSLRLRSSDGRCIWVATTMRGFAEFAEQLGLEAESE